MAAAQWLLSRHSHQNETAATVTMDTVWKDTSRDGGKVGHNSVKARFAPKGELSLLALWAQLCFD